MVMLRIVTTVTAAGALGKICSTLGVAARETSPFRSSDYHSREHQLGSNDIRTQVTPSVPLVVNTWTEDFASATKQAWSVISSAIETEGTSALLDAVEAGCNVCEDIQCGGSVGYGGHPDSRGEVTLDSMVMYGPLHSVGAVGCLRRIKNAATVARAVMEHTEHTMLAGEGATAFAKMMGMEEEDLGTAASRRSHESWVAGQCQPNYYRHFDHDEDSCPPYANPSAWHLQETGAMRGEFSEENALIMNNAFEEERQLPHATDARLLIAEDNHDTIGMVIIDQRGDLACGTTTNGVANKIAGRVGDSPVPGAGCYVENDVGGAAATGDGDVMMRFLPSYRAVESLRNGASPADACTEALCEIAKFYPTFGGALICVNKEGEHGAAHHGLSFSYSYQGPGDDGPQIGHAVKADERACSLVGSIKNTTNGIRSHANRPIKQKDG